MSALLTPGTPAPEFTLHVTPDQSLSHIELRGGPVILAFSAIKWPSTTARRNCWLRHFLLQHESWCLSASLQR
jgi:peroxiredoxin